MNAVGAPDKLKDPLRIEFLLNVGDLRAVGGARGAGVAAAAPGATGRRTGSWRRRSSRPCRRWLYPDRTAAFSDIAANTLGALLGSVAVTLGRALVRARRAGD